jgi:3-phenylpropionate/trans-cinnamate dioxygenase ferredoxin subunit
MIRACALMDLPPGEAVRIVGPQAPMAERPVKTHPVYVKDGVVYVDAEVNKDVA